MNVEDNSSERTMESTETVGSCGGDTDPGSGEKPVNEGGGTSTGNEAGEPYTDP